MLEKRYSVHAQSQFPLHLMVNQLTVSTLTVALRNHSVIVNDVPAGLYVGADQHQLATILGKLMSVVIRHARNCAIHITAKSYGNITLLHLKGKARMNNDAMSGPLSEIRQLANQVGGTVDVTSYRNDVTTIALSFLNQHVRPELLN